MTSQLINTQLARLQNRLRYAEQPDNPNLFSEYWREIERSVEVLPNKRKKLSQIHRAAQLMLEILCDSRLPLHWRQQCLQHIYQPVLALEALSHSREEHIKLARFKSELNAMTDYFFNS